MPLAAAMAALCTGFLLPWRFGLEWAGRTTWVSAGDAALAGMALVTICARPRRLAREIVTAGTGSTGWALALLLSLATFHAFQTPAAAGGGAYPAVATAWAIVAGLVLTRVDRGALLDGLLAGVLVSAAAGLAVLPHRPDLVTEHKYFAAFCGAKNTFAFLAALAGLHAAHRLAARRGREALVNALALVATATILAAANARAAAVALGAALVILPGGGRGSRILRGTVALGSVLLASGAALPWDRVRFAWAIAAHADGIPLVGLGPGFGYGLDTFLKMALELGPLGAAAALLLVLSALRRRGLDPWLVLALVTALAHDAARWPLFWMILLERAKRV